MGVFLVSGIAATLPFALIEGHALGPVHGGVPRGALLISAAVS